MSEATKDMLLLLAVAFAIPAALIALGTAMLYFQP